MSNFSTQTVHAGERASNPYRAITTPIVQSSTFTFKDSQDMIDYMEGKLWGDKNGREEYSRYGNPTINTVEAKLAELDGGEMACLFSSGMAAVTTTLFSQLSAGSHLVMTDDCYVHTRIFVRDFLSRFGVTYTQVPIGDWDALEAAIQPNTKLILSESPTNPKLRVVDLDKLVEVAKRHKLKTVIDSTFATPINQRPLAYGIDFVIYSATKYLGGHNDLLAGVVIGDGYQMTAVKQTQALMGDICDPHAAYLLQRGIKTLGLRMERHNQTACALAQFLAQHPLVRQVYYPGLPSHPDYAIASTQMSGFGGVVSFELEASEEETCRFIDALQIPAIGLSLGGVESLVEQVGIACYYGLSSEERAEIGVSDSLVRLAVGIEDTEDLVADMQQALNNVFV